MRRSKLKNIIVLCISIFLIATFLIKISTIMKLSNIQNKKPAILKSRQNQNETYRNRNYIFFDLGANNGDSILTFFELEPKLGMFKQNNYNYKKFGPEAAQAEWTVFAFEANPAFNEDLERTARILESQTNHRLVVFRETAAWTYNGTIKFYLESLSGMGVGSSLDRKHRNILNQPGFKEIQVACLDVASIIKQNDLNDFIVMKIDIEGAEYDLIFDFIRKDAIQWIDYFIVEYHSFINRFKNPEAVFNSLLSLYGSNASEWII